jgi:hypothetical protein
MPSVSCPTCGEKGKIPARFIGIRIKCKKCGSGFLVEPPAPRATAATTVRDTSTMAEHRPDGIEVEGLDDKVWSATDQHDPHHEHHDDPASSFSATSEPGAEPAFTPTAVKQYKILTPKDKWFDNKFDLVRLEEALNHFAKQGWVVRSMSTPQIAGFSGAVKEEFVILLER